MTKKKIIFHIFDVDWRSGGTMVMHYLSKILSDMGEEVYLTITQTKLPDDKSKIISKEEAITMAQNNDVVVLYPEVIVGNPLNAKNVARWLLYYPGVIGGEKQYHPSELVFTFFDRFVKDTPYENSPLLTIIQTRLNQFYPMNMERNLDCVLIKKGMFNFQQIKQKYFDPYEKLFDRQIIVFDQIINQTKEVEHLNLVFNQIRNFISFDQVTYYSIMASLAGCTSIVLPIDGLDKEKWIEQMPTYKYGIAYGFEDKEWSLKTRNELVSVLKQTESENILFAKNFIETINKKWNN